MNMKLSLNAKAILHQLQQGFPIFFLAMYPFSILTDEYVTLNFLMTKYFIMLNHKYI